MFIFFIQCVIGIILGLYFGKINSDLTRYKKMWNTLKAESGYRQTINSEYKKDLYVWQIMDNIEQRKEG